MAEAISKNQSRRIAQEILDKVKNKEYALSSDLPEPASDEDIFSFIEDLGGEPVELDHEGTSSRFQYSSMPPANEENLGRVIQYIGATEADGSVENIKYLNGGFYKCEYNNGVYSWVPTTSTGRTSIDAMHYPINQYLNMGGIPVAERTSRHIVQYTGDTNEEYTHGHFYEYALNDENIYVWKEVNVGGGGVGESLSEREIDDPTDQYGATVLCGEGAERFNCYEGDYATAASGIYSHAEGAKTLASGEYSHAEGFETIASGNYSHAEGYHTSAGNYASHVCGKYNKSMNTDGSDNNTVGDVLVIGNGTSVVAI